MSVYAQLQSIQYLGDVLPTFLARYPALRVALEYADKTNIKVEILSEADFLRIYPGESEAIGIASLENRTVHLNLHYVASDWPQLFDATTHEIKHIAQGDAFPLYDAWGVFIKDLKNSLETGKDVMKRDYVLTSILDSSILTVVAELDAQSYGHLVRDGMLKHDLKEAFYWDLMGDIATPYLRDWCGGIKGWLDNICEYKEKFGSLPLIKWSPSLTPEDIKKIVAPFWSEIGREPIVLRTSPQAILHLTRSFYSRIYGIPELTAAAHNLFGSEISGEPATALPYNNG